MTRFHSHLQKALTMLYDQGNRSVMLTMRLAMARLVDATMMYLMLNKTFHDSFAGEWKSTALFLNCVSDNIFFRKAGLLEPVDGHELMVEESDKTLDSGTLCLAADT
jgi:hypothetical protein